MSETESPHLTHPPVIVFGVQPGDPPFRIVRIGGETVGVAHSLFDVLEIAHRNGMPRVDLDDPELVRWVGGDKFTWVPQPGPF